MKTALAFILASVLFQLGVIIPALVFLPLAALLGGRGDQAKLGTHVLLHVCFEFLTMLAAVWVAVQVFRWFDREVPIWAFVIWGLLLIANGLQRIRNAWISLAQSYGWGEGIWARRVTYACEKTGLVAAMAGLIVGAVIREQF